MLNITINGLDMFDRLLIFLMFDKFKSLGYNIEQSNELAQIQFEMKEYNAK